MQPDHLPATDTCPHCNMSAIIASVNFLRNRKELFDIVAFLQQWIQVSALRRGCQLRMETGAQKFRPASIYP